LRAASQSRGTNPGDLSFECPGYNTVKEVWTGSDPETGWELMLDEKQAKNDFNGDGKSDILWRNQTTGQVYVWLMNGQLR